LYYFGLGLNQWHIVERFVNSLVVEPKPDTKVPAPLSAKF